MRRLFIDQESAAVQYAVRQQIEPHHILVAMHCSFLSSSVEVANVARVRGFSYKIKSALELVGKHIMVQDKKSEMAEASLSNRSNLGFSCSGQVLVTGSAVTCVRPGDFVACMGIRNPQYGNLIKVPDHLVVRIKNQELLTAASLSGVGVQALNAVRHAEIQIGTRVCVIGLGLLGQLVTQLSRHSGAFTVGIDIVPDRIKLAEACGADAVYNATSDDVLAETLLLTQGVGVDVVCIAAASKSADVINQAISIVRKRGRIIVIGDVLLDIDRARAHAKQVEIVLASSYGMGSDEPVDLAKQSHKLGNAGWTAQRNLQTFVELIEKKSLNIDPLISEEVTLESLDQVYTRIKAKQVLAVVLRYPQKTIRSDFLPAVVDTTFDEPVRVKPLGREVARVAIVGAGRCEQNGLLSCVENLVHAQVGALMEANEYKSFALSQKFSAATICMSEEEIFESDTADVVVVSSAQSVHASHIMRGLSSGKAVFAEQPLATTAGQLEEIKQFFARHARAPFCMNFYRSYAPFIRKIKSVVEKRVTPLMLMYRINDAGVFSEASFKDGNRSGKIIGQAAHLLDLFGYITSAKPVSVSVESLHAARSDIFPTDNWTAHINFDDGSVCSLLYTSQGNAGMGAERMEIFFDGKSIIMDDYVGLYGFGVPSWFNETVSTPDKGQRWLLEEFFAACRQELFVSPIPLERVITATHVAFVLDQLACEGGGAHRV